MNFTPQHNGQNLLVEEQENGEDMKPKTIWELEFETNYKFFALLPALNLNLHGATL